MGDTRSSTPHAHTIAPSDPGMNGHLVRRTNAHAAMQRTSVALLLTALAFGASAQSLLVHLEDGSTESYAISTIRSITFESGDMQLNLLAGTTLAWPIAEVRSYAFDPLTTAVDTHDAWGLLQVFPNPASEQVTIRFEQRRATRASIVITDIAGRTVVQLFQGEAPAGSTRFTWDPREQGAARAGLYLCRITTEHGVLSAPILIQ